MDVVIELISRSRRVIERHHYTGDSVTIGRAYDNDLIISDPHLSPHHAVLQDLGEAGWQIQDLESVNGVYTRRNQRIAVSAPITSGDEIVMGKTHLRIYDRRHPVAAAVSMNPVEKIVQPLSRTWNTVMYIAFALLIIAIDSYLDLYIEFDFRHIFVDTMGLVLLGMVWALIWALVGRLMRHDARFLMQLAITMTYLLCVIFFSSALDLLAFNSGSDTVAFAIGVFGHFILFASLLWLNLYIAISQTDRKRMLMSTGIAAAVAAMLLIYYLLNIPEFTGRPEYVYYLKPPALQWLEPVDTGAFLQDADAIFDAVRTQID